MFPVWAHNYLQQRNTTIYAHFLSMDDSPSSPISLKKDVGGVAKPATKREKAQIKMGHESNRKSEALFYFHFVVPSLAARWSLLSRICFYSESVKSRWRHLLESLESFLWRSLQDTVYHSWTCILYQFSINCDANVKFTLAFTNVSCRIKGIFLCATIHIIPGTDIVRCTVFTA